MAVTTHGIVDLGYGIDKTFLLSTELKTTSADYTPVFALGGTATDKTVHGILTEAVDNLHFVGMLQGGNSANSTVGKVRLLGVSKAKAGAAITFGQWVVPADSSLGTTDVGGSVLAHAAIATAGTIDESGTASWLPNVVIGRALQAAAGTGDALTIFVNPFIGYQTV